MAIRFLPNIKRDKPGSEDLKQFFARKGVQWAIVRSTSAGRGLVSAWAKEGLPLVLLGDHFECPGLLSVYAASGKASREAIEHLISLGHQRIASLRATKMTAITWTGKSLTKTCWSRMGVKHPGGPVDYWF